MVNWNESEWKSYEMEKWNGNKMEFCTAQNLGPVVFPEKLDAFDALHLCKQFNAELFAITKENIGVLSWPMDYPLSQFCKVESPSQTIWAGWTDENTEGTFTNINDPNQIMDFNLWRRAEPNGLESENCAALVGDTFLDISCAKEYCSMCDLGPTPVFKIRGLCKDTVFDLHYGWTKELSGSKYVFQGFSTTTLFWNETAKYWILQYRE